MRNVFDELNDRGFLQQVSHDALQRELLSQHLTVYAGFDPTASSLHVGHLLPIMALAHFQKHGHRPLVVVGGATGMVGDPSGRSTERNLLTPEAVAENARHLKKQMAKFLNFDGESAAVMLDNNDWIGPMSFVDWLCDVGKFFTVNYMLAKESVRSRVESEAGISFAEFCYMTMQAYDFLYLFDKFGCTLQCGGNDQWGNITAGIDLIRKTRAASAYGLTFPLISTSSGEKFGKSAGNAIWLDPTRTSVYQFYQYWIRTDDVDVERFLKFFTFVPLERIEEICSQHLEAPELRRAQKFLAEEATRLVHGEEAVVRARSASEALFGGELGASTKSDLEEIFRDVPTGQVNRERVRSGMLLTILLCEAGVCSSKGESRRMIEQGAIYVNNVRVNETDRLLSLDDVIADNSLVVRKGKKEYFLLRVVE